MTERRLQAAANQAVNYRNYRRARDRALTRLAGAHPEEYKQLLEREKANDELLGKKWIDIAGSTVARGVGTRATAATTEASGGNHRENEGNDGGEG